MEKAKSKPFIKQYFPALLRNKILTSRMYENRDNPTYKDDWWINFDVQDLDNYEYLVFAGALDYQNKNFKLFKVPTDYLKANLGKLYRGNNGWVIIYLHIKDFVDVRNEANLCFKDFAIN